MENKVGRHSKQHRHSGSGSAGGRGEVQGGEKVMMSDVPQCT